MPTLAIAITTAPRPKELIYLPQTLISLYKAGFQQAPQIFAEPDTPIPWGLRYIHQQPTKLGCMQNWIHALKWAVQNTIATHIMISQDDVLYRSDCYQRLLEGMELPEVGFLSPYTSPAMVSKTSGATREGWHPANHGPRRGFWGACSLVLPRQAAIQLLANKRFQEYTASHRRGVDVIVANCLADMGLRRLVHVPSLCDHLGKKSSIGRDKIKGTSWGRKGYGFREFA